MNRPFLFDEITLLMFLVGYQCPCNTDDEFIFFFRISVFFLEQHKNEGETERCVTRAAIGRKKRE